MTQFAKVVSKLDSWDINLIMDRLTAAYNEGVEEGIALLPYGR